MTGTIDSPAGASSPAAWRLPKPSLAPASASPRPSAARRPRVSADLQSVFFNLLLLLRTSDRPRACANALRSWRLRRRHRWVGGRSPGSGRHPGGRAGQAPCPRGHAASERRRTCRLSGSTRSRLDRSPLSPTRLRRAAARQPSNPRGLPSRRPEHPRRDRSRQPGSHGRRCREVAELAGAVAAAAVSECDDRQEPFVSERAEVAGPVDGVRRERRIARQDRLVRTRAAVADLDRQLLHAAGIGPDLEAQGTDELRLLLLADAGSRRPQHHGCQGAHARDSSQTHPPFPYGLTPRARTSPEGAGRRSRRWPWRRIRSGAG